MNSMHLKEENGEPSQWTYIGGTWMPVNLGLKSQLTPDRERNRCWRSTKIWSTVTGSILAGALQEQQQAKEDMQHPPAWEWDFPPLQLHQLWASAAQGTPRNTRFIRQCWQNTLTSCTLLRATNSPKHTSFHPSLCQDKSPEDMWLCSQLFVCCVKQGKTFQPRQWIQIITGVVWNIPLNELVHFGCDS